MEISPHVMFGGQCREAFTAYQQVLGRTLQVKTYGERPPANGPAQPPDHVMHARLAAHGAILMASDRPDGDAGKDSVWVSLTVGEVEEAERIFSTLAEGGHVVMPIGEAFGAVRFGMLKDRFGVSWMLNCTRPQ